MYMHAGPNGNQTGPHCSSVSTNVVVPNLIRLVQLLLACRQIQSTPYEKPSAIAYRQNTRTNQSTTRRK